MIALLALMTCWLDIDDIAKSEHVDVIEHNSLYDDRANLILKQLIFWDLRNGRYIARDWRLDRGQFNTRRANGMTRITWCDSGKLRTVTTTRYFKSWTQFDPELVNRDVLPQDERPKRRR